MNAPPTFESFLLFEGEKKYSQKQAKQYWKFNYVIF